LRCTGEGYTLLSLHLYLYVTRVRLLYYSVQYENPANHTPSPSSSRKMCIRRHYCYINTHFLRTSRASGVLRKTRNVLIENRSARRTRKKCLRRPRSCQADRRRKLYHGYPLANKPGNVQCTLHVVSEFIPRSSTWPRSIRFTFSRDGNRDNFRVVGYWLGTMKKTRSSPSSSSAEAAFAVRFPPKALRQGKMHIGYSVLKNISKIVRRLYHSILTSSRNRDSEKCLVWLFEYNSVLNELNNRAVQYNNNNISENLFELNFGKYRVINYFFWVVFF